MAELSDVDVVALVKEREFINKETNEPFKITTVNGYVRYEGIPVRKVSGRILDDVTLINKSTKVEFTVSKMVLNFHISEDVKDEGMKMPESLFLRRLPLVNRSNKNKFTGINSESTYVAKGDDRNCRCFNLNGFKMHLNGIERTGHVIDDFGEKCKVMHLTADGSYSLKVLKDDMFKEDSDETKVGLMKNFEGPLFEDEELEVLKSQFTYYNKFMKDFNGEVFYDDSDVSNEGDSDKKAAKF